VKNNIRRGVSNNGTVVACPTRLHHHRNLIIEAFHFILSLQYSLLSQLLSVFAKLLLVNSLRDERKLLGIY